MRTPLAWKNLTADWRRLMLGAAGVGFAAVLMFMQNGFRFALLDSPVQFLHVLQTDLIALSAARYSLPSEQTFDRSLLERAASDPDVVQITPMYIERFSSQIRVAGESRRAIRVIAVPLRHGLFKDPEVEQFFDLLRGPGTAIVDRSSRSEYKLALDDPEQLRQQSVELLNQRVRLVGTFHLGTDFANDGTLIMSQENFANYFPFRGNGQPLAQPDLGLIQIRQGADPQAVAQRLTELHATAWDVMPTEAIIEREINFWSRQTPVGKIFTVGALMGFAVGVIICYQILFTSIHDSMPEFATLKAMGYPNRFFLGLVVRQSIYLSLIGFIPAVFISWGLFLGLQAAVGLPMLLTPWRILIVLVLTVTMCLVSGLLALRKLLHADPASLF